MRDERQRSSIYTTAETILEAYADPRVLERVERLATSIRSRFLDGGSHTLYLSSTVREQRRLRPLFVALIQSVVQAAYERAAATGRPLDPPLLVVLDEAANIAPLPDLDVLASTGAGQGVQLLTVLQDLAQAHDRWGRDRADTIVNNHRAKVIGAGDVRPADARMGVPTARRRRARPALLDRGRRSPLGDALGHLPLDGAGQRRAPGPTRHAVLVNGNLPPSLDPAPPVVPRSPASCDSSTALSRARCRGPSSR